MSHISFCMLLLAFYSESIIVDANPDVGGVSIGDGSVVHGRDNSVGHSRDSSIGDGGDGSICDNTNVMETAIRSSVGDMCSTNYLIDSVGFSLSLSIGEWEKMGVVSDGGDISICDDPWSPTLKSGVSNMSSVGYLIDSPGL